MKRSGRLWARFRARCWCSPAPARARLRVVTFRIANLIRHGTPPDRILAVTFTNKAAGEMKQRIGELLRNQGATAAEGQGRNGSATDRQHLSFSMRPHPASARQSARLPGQVFDLRSRRSRIAGSRRSARTAAAGTAALAPPTFLDIIGRWKNASVQPEQAAAVAGTDKEHLAAAGYRRYQNALTARGAMDFDDLLLLTETLFDQHPAIRDEEAAQYDHVLVDEYQDTNGSQYRITRHLTLRHRNLCVVGDDDQSIYAWRGADVTHILNFTNDWPDAKVVCLESNYRSTGAILEMANRLIEFNSNRHDKVLRPSRPEGTRPRIVQHKDEITEAQIGRRGNFTPDRSRTCPAGRYRHSVSHQRTTAIV